MNQTIKNDGSLNDKIFPNYFRKSIDHPEFPKFIKLFKLALENIPKFIKNIYEDNQNIIVKENILA